jgi:hypothetical protein
MQKKHPGYDRKELRKGWTDGGRNYLYGSPRISGSKPCSHASVSGAVTTLYERKEEKWDERGREI